MKQSQMSHIPTIIYITENTTKEAGSKIKGLEMLTVNLEPGLFELEISFHNKQTAYNRKDWLQQPNC